MNIKRLITGGIITDTLITVSTLFAGLIVGLTPWSKPLLAEVVIPVRCHTGYCMESKLISKTLLKSDVRGDLFSITLATRSWEIDSFPSGPFVGDRVSYVYCSKTNPAFIFHSDGKLYADLLNPGEHRGGVTIPSYNTYWAICHDLIVQSFLDPLTTLARQLGYPLNLETGRIELDNVFDISMTSHRTHILTAAPDSRINIRSGPGLHFEVTHSGMANDRVLIKERTTVYGTNSPGLDWSEVIFIESGASGWVRNDLLINSKVNINSEVNLGRTCHEQIALARTRINDVPDEYFNSISLEENSLSPYRERPYQLGFVMRGRSHVLESPQFMQDISRSIIQNCPQVSSVEFASYGSFAEYGLINNRVQRFTCVERNYRILRWGETFCG